MKGKNVVIMENISVEQIIKLKQPADAIFYKVGLAVLTIVSIFLIRYLVGFGVILTACFGLFLVLLWRYYDAEFEYELVDNRLSVDRIMAKSARRHCGTYDIGKIEIMAPAFSEKIAYKEHQKLKTFDYSSNTDKSNTFIAYLPSENEMVRVILEPDERMLDAIKSIARGKVYDKSNTSKQS